MEITIDYVDGTKEVFKETYRSGGSWCTKYQLECGWVVITNAYGEQTMIPADRVKHIKTSGDARW